MAKPQVRNRAAPNNVKKQPEQVPGESANEELPKLSKLGLADFVTMLNAGCGILSIFLCLNYLENAHYEKYIVLAFFLLPLSFILDILDGVIARRSYSSPFGKDLDSLADLISFGITPACLGFTLGLRGFWDSAIMAFFVVCCMVRLARFNVTAKFITGENGKVQYYEGLPSPSNLLIVAMLYVAYMNDRIHDDNVWGGKFFIYPGHFHPLSVVYIFFGVGMITNIRIKKF